MPIRCLSMLKLLILALTLIELNAMPLPHKKKKKHKSENGSTEKIILAIPTNNGFSGGSANCAGDCAGLNNAWRAPRVNSGWSGSSAVRVNRVRRVRPVVRVNRVVNSGWSGSANNVGVNCNRNRNCGTANCGQ